MSQVSDARQTPDVAAAIRYFHEVEQKISMCMAGPDARDDALARLAQFGDPAQLLDAAVTR